LKTVHFLSALGKFMRNLNKFIVGLTALAVVIGLCLYLNRKPAPPASPATPGSVTVQTTNRPPVHVQRPTVAVYPPEVPEQSDPSQSPREKAEEYLRRHNRNAASLLAAYHGLQDTNYLFEAATNFPNDPHVQRTVLAQNLFPDDRRKWLDAFKASSPSNSLATYLSAQDYFKNHQPDAAIKELLAASAIPQFNQYSMDSILDSEDFSQFNGTSGMMAQVSAMSAMASDNLPEVAGMKGVAVGIRDAQQQYVNSGDTASAQSLAQAGVTLADHLMNGDSGKFIINQLVGIASENLVLAALDQNTAYNFLGGETPAQKLADLQQQKTAIRELAKHQNVFLSLDPQQQASYWERMKIYGELPAMQWGVQQTATTPNTGN
jgi:hypothetical protein